VPGQVEAEPEHRVSLPEPGTSIRFTAVVVWTSFEIPPNSGPRYRAGLDFQDADVEALGASAHGTRRNVRPLSRD
jgi:hypothetical protein